MELLITYLWFVIVADTFAFYSKVATPNQSEKKRCDKCVRLNEITKHLGEHIIKEKKLISR